MRLSRRVRLWEPSALEGTEKRPGKFREFRWVSVGGPAEALLRNQAWDRHAFGRAKPVSCWFLEGPKVLMRRYCGSRLPFGTDKLFPWKAPETTLLRTSSKTSSSWKAEDSIEHVHPSFSPRRTPPNRTGVRFRGFDRPRNQ